MFSVWPKIQPKTTENDFSRYFHFKAFPPLSHTHKSLTHALPLSSLHCSDPHTEPNGTIHTDAPRSRSRRSPKLRRSTSITIAIAPIVISRSTLHAIAIAPIGVDRDHRNQRDCDRDLADRDRADHDRDRDLTEKICCPSGFYLSFWVLFEFLGMNDIMCLFGSWENVRKLLKILSRHLKFVIKLL